MKASWQQSVIPCEPLVHTRGSGPWPTFSHWLLHSSSSIFRLLFAHDFVLAHADGGFCGREVTCRSINKKMSSYCYCYCYYYYYYYCYHHYYYNKQLGYGFELALTLIVGWFDDHSVCFPTEPYRVSATQLASRSLCTNHCLHTMECKKKALKNQGAPLGEALQNDGGLLGFAV